jgi:hypothetical protein
MQRWDRDRVSEVGRRARRRPNGAAHRDDEVGCNSTSRERHSHRAGNACDFGWMRLQPDFDDTLFIFNDNFEQFSLHLQQPDSPEGCAAGGTAQAIYARMQRLYRKRDPSSTRPERRYPEALDGTYRASRNGTFKLSAAYPQSQNA